ncbi:MULTISPECIES: purine-nucleoside phosphorylase [unclassified Brachybacterium]|uniref:purine-nucleoside phosphorylase n=1 Tax=unclassified Brachybacterium TaxID=2623841 RepID=UPI000C803668|nr:MULTISPECIES: purine-nucleoside phosphorylase [unclassified Brachybacterium]PMC74447.1 purine-nucleoside phosphorylase [Brachybacterium sp. UMB0905]
MSTHIGATPDQIAPHVLMPGDPYRARWIAETFLEDPVQYNDVRGMLGFTGTYQGVRISAQGSGMGQPSMAIYAHELLAEYDVQTIIRVGSCGGLSEAVKVRDVVLGVAASTDSAMNVPRFGHVNFAPAADFTLARIAAEVADERLLPWTAGGLFSADQFYNPSPEVTKNLAQYGVLGVEMEAAALYTLAAQFSRRALALCTVSDHLITGEETSAQERQETFEDMIVMALETIVRLERDHSTR